MAIQMETFLFLLFNAGRARRRHLWMGVALFPYLWCQIYAVSKFSCSDCVRSLRIYITRLFDETEGVVESSTFNAVQMVQKW